MRNRVSDLLLRAGIPPAQPWLSTFHSLCARLLRRESTAAGLPRDFAIYDDDDQVAAVKLAMAKLQIDVEDLTPRNVLSRISYAKNHGQTSEQLRAEAIDQNGRRTADIFAGYEKLLHDSTALDFDDLLLRSARLLRESTATREKWQARFQYIHVDEYQDTNRVQYELMRLLTGPKQNVCVVGDEDQSIYRWRGADVSILLSFSRDFPATRIVKLERNYRSTQNILDAAGAVVANNPERLGKSLSAEKGPGTNLKYLEARDAQAEAEFVAGELERILGDDSDQTCAVEYRTNFQSRAFEEVFRRRGLRYKLVGGFSFYNRAEVKDALAYVRLAMHPEDDISLLRVLNVPPRGIGKTTVDALRESARIDGTPLWAAIEKYVSGASAGRAVTPLRAFQELIRKLQDALATKEPPGFLHAVLEESGYMAMLKDRNTPEDVARLENLEELARALAEGMEAGETFTDFLDAAALVSDADQFEGKPGVTLITLHSTKGLEFDHVFLTGMEEGICPHSRAITEEKGIEEERRLVYVGMTRARQSLTLTRAAAAIACFPAVTLSCRNSKRAGGNGARINGGNWRDAPLRARPGVFVFARRIPAAGARRTEAGRSRSASPVGSKLLRASRCEARRRCQSHAGAQSSPSELRRWNHRWRRRRRRRPPRIRELPRPRNEKVYRAVRAARTGITFGNSPGRFCAGRLRDRASRGTLRRVHSSKPYCVISGFRFARMRSESMGGIRTLPLQGYRSTAVGFGKC